MPGRPRIVDRMHELAVPLARENRAWGWNRIEGALRNVGHDVGRTTVTNILKAQGIETVRLARSFAESERPHRTISAALEEERLDCRISFGERSVRTATRGIGTHCVRSGASRTSGTT